MVLSTPYSVIISVPIAIELLPEMGLRILRGITSLGICSKFVTGAIKLTIKSKIPESLRSPIATNRPIKVGKILTTVSMPSLAPSKKTSKTLTFSITPYTTIIRIVKGIASEEK